jgi:hypothetical protein
MAMVAAASMSGGLACPGSGSRTGGA